MRTQLENLAGVPRHAWVIVTFPADPTALYDDEATFVADDGRRFRAVQGRTRGGAVTTWRIFGTFDENEKILGNLYDVPHKDHRQRYAPHPWVSDNVRKLQPYGAFRDQNFGEFNEGGQTLKTELIGHDQSHQRWHIKRLMRGGVVFECWTEFRHLDPVGEVKGFFAWSDQNDPRPTKLINALALLNGEHIALDRVQLFGSAAPFVSTSQGSQGDWVTTIASEIELGDGDGICFSGRMLCAPEERLVPAETDFEDFSDPVAASFMALQAAHEGPVVGMCLEWAGQWTASRHAPRMSEAVAQDLEADRQRWDRMRSEPRGFAGRRPFGLQENPSQTGNQDDFGATHGLHLLEGMSDMMEAYRDSAYADALRGILRYEPDGTRLDLANHPDWVTWSGKTHWHTGVSPDRLGKDRTVIANWRGYDREHRSRNALAAYAWMTDDPVIDALIDHQLTNDQADIRFRRRQRSKARAEGRCIADFAHMALISDDQRREGFLQLLNDVAWQQLSNNERLVDQRAMRVLSVNNPDGRKPIFSLDADGKPTEELVPTISVWEHGLAAVGMAVAMNSFEDDVRAASVEPVFQIVLEFLATWGCFQQEGTGQWYVVDDMHYNEGAPLSGGLDINNPLLIARQGQGTSGWTLYGIGVAAEYLEDEALKQKARNCWLALSERAPTGRRDSTWRAAFEGRDD